MNSRKMYVCSHLHHVCTYGIAALGQCSCGRSLEKQGGSLSSHTHFYISCGKGLKESYHFHFETCRNTGKERMRKAT